MTTIPTHTSRIVPDDDVIASPNSSLTAVRGSFGWMVYDGAGDEARPEPMTEAEAREFIRAHADEA
jgi:hypothetical protein